VRLAARGARDMDDGVQPVMERAERAALRRRARGLQLRATLWTVAGVVLALALRLAADRLA